MDYIITIIALFVGLIISFLFFKVMDLQRVSNSKKEAEKIVEDAKEKSKKIIKDSEVSSREKINKAKKESNDIIQKAEKLEQRLQKREDKLEHRLEEIGKRQDDILSREEKLRSEFDNLEEKRKGIDEKISEISKLSEDEARDLFLDKIKTRYESDAVGLIEKHKRSVEERRVEIAREIIIKAIQQYVGDVTNEVTTTLIELPNDNIKGKLIGKEGRNIITFEKATGVSLIIDDTPDTAFISSFDLYRRYIAKKSLEKLIEDGRIQPARIEEIVENTIQEAEILLREIGNKAIDELGLVGIPDEMIPLIGKMRFRTSYGQNMLKHSREVGHIAKSIAKDLGLDPKIAEMGGFLHDIGKAIDHDVEGTHPELGAQIGRKYGLSEKIVDMIENHHGEHDAISIYAAIVQMADAISSVRPGARSEATESFLKRVTEMENIATRYSGVKKAYAISAGREVRVFVDRDKMSDLDSYETARNIAKEIEEKLSYPGEVKVNLIREMRVIEYAK